MNSGLSFKPNPKEIEMTPVDVTRVCSMIYAKSGIVLNSSKDEMIYGRLSKRIREKGLVSFKPYLDQLENNPSSDEWARFINALTTNLTAFYREPHHFPILGEHVKKLNRPVRIWCAAASTGEEPYTLAMTLAENMTEFNFKQSLVYCSDIDTDALNKAKQGIYRYDQVSGFPQQRLKDFFLKGSGDNSGFVKVTSSLKSILRFEQINLNSNSWGISGPFDAIFCRNIMIYFDIKSQRDILDKFSRLIANDGLLITGHSETFDGLDSDFKLLGKTVYTLANKNKRVIK